MRHRSVRVFGFILLLVAVSPVGAATPAPPVSSGGAYMPAKSCGACHDAMFKAWSGSAHARSVTSAAYLETLRRTVEQAQDKKAAWAACVWCHAPTTILTGDLELQQPLSREGITCDFCHTVAAVN